jgi:hypothetical protein
MQLELRACKRLLCEPRVQELAVKDIDTSMELPASCPSCGAKAAGRYCCMCGERFLSESDFDFKHFLFHHVPDEVMHWDGKLGRTLRELVFAPGEMAAQVARGRRQPYLNPLRLYLVVFVVQAFLSGIGVPELTFSERVQRFDTTGLAARFTAWRMQHGSGELAYGLHSAAYSHWFSEAGTLVIFLLVACVQLSVFRKYHRRYLEHLTLALNVVTFSMLVLIVGDIVTLAAGRGTVSDIAFKYRNDAVAYTLPIYWFFAIRRFYGASWSGSSLYGIAITAANVLIAIGLNAMLLLLVVATAQG